MRDGLNSSILPNSRGASGGKGLPPRTHALHTILYRSSTPLSLDEIERRLAAWGYESATSGVSRNHLDHLCMGWGKDNVIAAVRSADGLYSLTPEGRRRLAAGPFSDKLRTTPATAGPIPTILPSIVPIIADEDESGREGRELLRLHKLRERNQKLVARKKRQVLAATGQLLCEVCEFNFAAVYGPRGEGFAECHHRQPISQKDGERNTRLSDLAIVCANELFHPQWHKSGSFV